MKRMRVVTRALSMASTVSGSDWAEVERVIVVASVIREKVKRAGEMPALRNGSDADRGCEVFDGAAFNFLAKRIKVPTQLLKLSAQTIRRPPRMAIGGAGGRGGSRRD